MARRRGFLAEIQRQQKLAQSRANAAYKAQVAAQARVERAQAAAQRAAAAAARANENERKRLEKEAHAAYVEARIVETDRLNEALIEEYAEIDGILEATLTTDDWVDLEAMKLTVDHPPFPRRDLQIPVPTSPPIEVPPEPVYQEPEPPTGLFGRKKKFEISRQQAWTEYQQSMHQWTAFCESVPAQQARIDAQHKLLEEERLRQLQVEMARYAADCKAREDKIAEHNDALEALSVGLGYGSTEAIEEYIGIVLANSIYPATFEVSGEAQFNPDSAELSLIVTVPSPDQIRKVKAFRYVKSTDTINETLLSKKEANDRYGGALDQVALRSLHEIFESDRRGVVRAVSLQVGPRAKDPATGREMYLPMIVVNASREKFMELDLSGVVPSATLQHLGATVSKNPSALSAVDPAGIRRA